MKKTMKAFRFIYFFVCFFILLGNTSFAYIEYSRKLTVLENTVFPKSPLFLFTSTFQGDFYIFSENFQIPIDKPASLCGRDY